MANDNAISTAELGDLRAPCRRTVSSYATILHVLAVMASLVLSACASTQLSHTWRDASYTAGPLKKILVVAVRKDQERRRTWEDGFAAALAEQGFDVTPSYRLIGETLPDTGRVNTTAREGGFDGILLIGRRSVNTTDRVTASVNITGPESPFHPWGGWYYTYYDREYYPGYPMEDDIVKDEIKVWATQGGGRMVWSGVGEVHDRGADEEVSAEMIPFIVSELVKDGVIATGS
jgi:hypothetical protein